MGLNACHRGGEFRERTITWESRMSRTKKELETENRELREVVEEVLDRAAGVLGYEDDENDDYPDDEDDEE